MMKTSLLLYIILSFILVSCAGHGGRSDYRSLCDSVADMPPAEAYARCRSRLISDPDADGRIYQLAYFKAIDADSVEDYASLLDSISAGDRRSPNRNYIASFRAVCSYVKSWPDLDSLVAAAAALPPAADRLQEAVTAQLLARIMVISDARQAYELQKRALEAMRGADTGKSVEILCQASELACRLGEYVQSMDYLNEARDTLEAQGWPQRETVFFYGDRANLYSTVKLYDSALVTNRRAIGYASISPALMTDVLTFRARIFADRGAADSAYFYLDSAERVIDRMDEAYAPILRRYVRAQRGVLSVLGGADGTRLREAADDLRKYVGCNSGMWEEKFALAVAGERLGDDSAPGRLENLVDSIARYDDLDLLLRANRRLIDVYIDRGRPAEATELFRQTFRLVDTLGIEDARTRSIAADVQYHARSHERENQMLRQIVGREEARVFWLAVACVMGIVMLVVITVYHVKSRRLARRSLEMDARQISTLLRNQKTLNSRLEELQSLARTETDWSSLTPSSMSSDDISRFRQSFMSLYPDFQTALQQRCPDLTIGDNTLCMLIRIGQTTDDIAMALGISRASVNSARYRIRKKMGLAKEDSLDDIIKAM